MGLTGQQPTFARCAFAQACALKLQSVFRGHRGRADGFRLIRRTRAALRLGAVYRGHLERARLRQSLAEEYAALQVRPPSQRFERDLL